MTSRLTASLSYGRLFLFVVTGLVAAFLVGALVGCTVSFSGRSGGNERCGDGILNPEEGCDDGNETPGDGCSAGCSVEPGWECDGEPSTCTTQCGDGLAVGTEACDATDFRGMTCQNLGLGDGQLGCTDGCQLNVQGCDIQAECGNGVVEYPEECDGDDLGEQTCEALGFAGGSLSCSADCLLDTTDCEVLTVCGDGIAEGAEECDTNDLRGYTCEALDLGGGALRCSDECVFDSSECELSASCGNGTIEYPEVCDGDNLGGESCSDFGFYSGTLSCSQDCSEFDTAGCSGVCGDGQANGPEVCDGDDFNGESCETQGFYSGTLSCSADCSSLNTSSCSGSCGDGTLNGLEVCDGDNLDFMSCEDLGYYGGVLNCDADCSGYDVTQCLEGPPILISEISMSNPDWVELYNTSTTISVDLEDWQIDYWGFDPSGAQVSDSLVFPAYTLGPGDRVIIEDTNPPLSQPPEVTPDKIKFYQNNFMWMYLPGAVALFMDDGTALDYVRWIDDTFSPPTGVAWSDTPDPLTSSHNDAYTISRKQDTTETDTADDFCVAPATPGAANASCETLDPPSTLLITELDLGIPDRVEIYNPTSSTIDLDGWALTWSFDGNGGSTGYAVLPSFLLHPGEYVELIDDGTHYAHVDFEDRIHIANCNWNENEGGSYTLHEPKGWAGVDFARWGGNTSSPAPQDSWSDSPQPVALPTNGTVIGRETLTDTDTAGDWCELVTDTLGGPNANCQ